MPRDYDALKAEYESWLEAGAALPSPREILGWLDELARWNTVAAKRTMSAFFESGRFPVMGHFFERLNGRQVALRHRLFEEVDAGEFFKTVVNNERLLTIFCHKSRHTKVKLSEHARESAIVLLRNAILFYPGYEDPTKGRSSKLVNNMLRFYRFLTDRPSLVTEKFEPNMMVSLSKMKSFLDAAPVERVAAGASAVVQVAEEVGSDAAKP